MRERLISMTTDTGLGMLASILGAAVLVSVMAPFHDEIGLLNEGLVLLLLTLASSVVTFGSGRTSVLQGCIHLLLFGVFLLLIFSP